MKRFALPVLVAAWIGVGPTPARAEDMSLISPQEKAAAKKAYAHALQLYKLGNYKEAAVELRKAYDHAPLPPILFNLGVTYAKLGNVVAARALLSEYVKQMPNAANRPEADRLLATLGGAEDGAAAPEGESAAARPDGAAAAAPVGEARTAAAARAGAPAAAPAGGPDDDTENPLTQTPRGTALGNQPERNGGAADRLPGPYRFWKWGVAGVSVAAVTVGVLMLSRASDQADALQQAAAQAGSMPTQHYDANVRALEDGYSQNRTWGTVAIIGGGVAAAASVTLFLLDHRAEKAQTQARLAPQITPVVAPGLAAVAAGVRF